MMLKQSQIFSKSKYSSDILPRIMRLCQTYNMKYFYYRNKQMQHFS